LASNLVEVASERRSVPFTMANGRRRSAGRSRPDRSLNVLRIVIVQVERTAWAVPIVDDVPLRDRLRSEAMPGVHRVGLNDWLEGASSATRSAEVLGATCGIDDCCAVYGRVTFTDHEVRWHDFLPNSPRDRWPGVEEIAYVFDRTLYLGEVRRSSTEEPLALPKEMWFDADSYDVEGPSPSADTLRQALQLR
jgi:hypothetical protein